MNPKIFYSLAILFVSGALLMCMGCSEAEVANTPPGSVTLAGVKCFVETGGTMALSASAVDEDGDPLTFRWAATAGSFTPASATGTSVQWTAPGTEGAATITMTVTDDIASVKKSHTVMVCTPFQGSVTTARTMSEGHTYLVKNAGFVPIAGSGTLTIEPGVTVVFNADGGFEVMGRLIAEGTAGQKIRLRGNTCGAETNAWAGIEINGTSAVVVLRNVEVSQSHEGIMFTEAGAGGELTVDRCTVYDNGSAGISVMGSSATAHILSSQIWENGTGVKISNGSADITASSICYNTMNGIWVSYSTGNTNVAIDSTAIVSNGENGVLLTNLANPVIHYCSIHSNGGDSATGYAIRLIGHIGSADVDARHNFWGAGNTADDKIQAVIYDGVDDPGLPLVDFSGYLLSWPPTN